MGKLVDELVNDSVDANCSTDQLKLRIVGVLKNEVVAIEATKPFTADTTSHLRERRMSLQTHERPTTTYSRDVIDVRLLNHSSHGVLNGAVGKLIVCVLIPDRFKVEERASDKGLEERQVPGMRECLGGVVELAGKGCGEFKGCERGIEIFSELGRASW